MDVILPSRRFSGYLPAKPPGVQSEPIFLAPSRYLNCCREEWGPIPQRDQLQYSLQFPRRTSGDADRRSGRNCEEAAIHTEQALPANEEATEVA
jgi:hypothetical protein